MLTRALATHYLPTRLTATHLHVELRFMTAAAAKTPPHTYTPALHQPLSSSRCTFLSPQRPPFQTPVLRTVHSSPYSLAADPYISHSKTQPHRTMSSTGGGAAADAGSAGSVSTLMLKNFTKLCDKVRAYTLYRPACAWPSQPLRGRHQIRQAASCGLRATPIYYCVCASFAQLTP